MVALTPLGEILIQEGRSQSWLAMQLAARLGRPVYRQEVYRWCHGIHEPEASTRAAIADVLDRQVHEIFPPVEPEAVAS